MALYCLHADGKGVNSICSALYFTRFLMSKRGLNGIINLIYKQIFGEKCFEILCCWADYLVEGKMIEGIYDT